MPYPGGKSGSGVYQTIVNQIPPHQVYIEAFLGGAAIMRLKRPALLNIGIDLVPEVLSAAETMTSTSAVIGVESGSFRLQGLRPKAASPAGKAGCGAGGSQSAGSTAKKGVRTRLKSAGNGVVRSRFEFHRADAIEWLKAYQFTGGELVYCDPPYMHETRGRTRRYQFEMSDAQHRALLEVLLTLPCPVIVSGYWTRLYERMLKGWRTVTFQAVNRAGKMATEWLWMNYPEPVALHDYAYVGEDARERWRIEKRRRRLVAR